jgi:hypothetical protein
MADLSFNCTCDDTFESRTLLQLRLSLMRALGFAAQATNPPPGMAALLNDFLDQAQRMLYWEVDDFRCSRFFSWDLVADIALYDIAANTDDCTRTWDPTKIEWVGIRQDEANVWTLYPGIRPDMRGTPSVGGYPSRYDIRQCIEVYPTPSAGNTDAKLIVKGEFGLLPFTTDAHVTTIDWMAVYLRALANAASHYGKQLVAKNAAAQEYRRMQKLTAASHLPGVRYIPGTCIRGDTDNLCGISGPRGIRFAQDGGVRFDQTEA